MATPQEMIQNVQEKFSDYIIETSDNLGEATITIKRERLVDLMQFLHDEPDLSFDFLMDVCGVDYLEMGGHERFGTTYHLYSMRHNHRVRVKTFIPETDSTVDTISYIWEAANWAEREVYDMYGIEFNNHPDMRRILNPDDFEGFPLRKEFPPEGIGYRESFEKIERFDAQ